MLQHPALAATGPLAVLALTLGLVLARPRHVTGSLATMLCLAIARRHGITISARAVLRAGAVSALPMLLAATLTLSLLLR